MAEEIDRDLRNQRALLPASAIDRGSPNLDAVGSRRLFPFLTPLILQILTPLFA